MKRVQLGITRLSAGLLAVVLCLGGAGRARAEFTFTFAQVGNNVTVTGMGSIDLTGLFSPGLFPHLTPGVEPAVAALVAGVPPSHTPVWGPIVGPASFGPGGATLADSSSGDVVGILGASEALFLPPTYISGDPLSDSATWDNTTISGLGLTPGTYIYTLPSGDTLEVIIPTPIPEPSTLSLLAAGLGMAGWWWKRRAV